MPHPCKTALYKGFLYLYSKTNNNKLGFVSHSWHCFFPHHNQSEWYSPFLERGYLNHYREISFNQLHDSSARYDHGYYCFQFYRWEEHPFGELKEKLNKVPLLSGSTGYLQLQNAKAKIILVRWTIPTPPAVHAHHSMLYAKDTSLIIQLAHTAEGTWRVGPANVLFSPLLPSSYSPFLSHKLSLKMSWWIKFLQFSDLAF